MFETAAIAIDSCYSLYFGDKYLQILHYYVHIVLIHYDYYYSVLKLLVPYPYERDYFLLILHINNIWIIYR